MIEAHHLIGTVHQVGDRSPVDLGDRVLLWCLDGIGNRGERVGNFALQLAPAQWPGQDPTIDGLEVDVPRHIELGTIARVGDCPCPFCVRGIAVGIARLIGKAPVVTIDLLDSGDAPP